MQGKYDCLDPAEHALAMIETCKGDQSEAIALAHMNMEFSENEEARDYWDRVAVAIMLTATRGSGLVCYDNGAGTFAVGNNRDHSWFNSLLEQGVEPVFPDFVHPAVDPVPSGVGQQLGVPLLELHDVNCTLGNTAGSVQFCSVLGIFTDGNGTILRTRLGDPVEFACHNMLLAALGIERRWTVPSAQS